MSKVFIEESTLSAIGNAIREKTGKSDLIGPLNMATEISSITTGGGGEEFEIPVITGICRYRFAHNGWNWFIEQFGNKITTNDISSANYMFYHSDTLENIPFDINFYSTSATTHSIGSMFYGCDQLKSVPKFNNCKIYDASSMFCECSNLRYIPEDFADGFDFSEIDENTNSSGAKFGNNVFQRCFALRSFPMEFLSHENKYMTSYYANIYYNLFQYCTSLDEVIGLPVHFRDVGISTNFFNSTFNFCYRLKNMTFAVQEDGTPYTAKWKNQIVDLGRDVGFDNGAPSLGASCINYNSGITVDKMVKDDATYQALKNDPDWYTHDKIYSRYNHDSAVATLNSLPDTSAYGTNTIKFKGANGSSTDGGAINTLTDEEIAVAAAKGWTVTLS